ncbi:TraR/DksA family transcriptional regulator [Patescibacteria group bacterium]|nr:TraR/DksA family transcriptional regulator [Patescibacteria group bacterium]
MNKESITKAQQKLEEKKKQLEQELSSFATKDPRIKGDWDTKYPRVQEGDLEDAANEVEEYSTKLHIEFSLEKQLKEVNSALERIAKGQYGMCENCVKEIPEERLLASPEAKLCLNCAKKQ